MPSATPKYQNGDASWSERGSRKLGQRLGLGGTPDGLKVQLRGARSAVAVSEYQGCGCSLGRSCAFSRLRRMKPTTCGGKPSSM